MCTGARIPCAQLRCARRRLRAPSRHLVVPAAAPWGDSTASLCSSASSSLWDLADQAASSSGSDAAITAVGLAVVAAAAALSLYQMFRWASHGG